jgi:hypothetical protein
MFDHSNQPTYSAIGSIEFTHVTPQETLRRYHALLSQQPCLGHYHAMTTTLMTNVNPRLLTIGFTPHQDHTEIPFPTVAAGIGPAGAAVLRSVAESDQHSIALPTQASLNPTNIEVLSEIVPDTSPIGTEPTSTHNFSEPRSDGVQCHICLKPKDRKSRADTCEKSHYGIKD